MANRNTIFTDAVFKRTRTRIKDEIIKATESNRDFRAEIRKVFQRANRRVQNLEKSGALSPALESLNLTDGHSFSVFDMKGGWADLKTKYARAVEFLRQPTSTATGAAQFEKHLMKEYDLTKDELRMTKDNIRGKLSSMRENDFVERYLMRYKDYTGYFREQTEDVADMIEQGAQTLENEMENEVERAADEITAAVDSLNKAFDDLGTMIKGFQI